MRSKLLKTASTLLFSLSLALGMLAGMSGTAKAADDPCPWQYFPPDPRAYCPSIVCQVSPSKSCKITYFQDKNGQLIVLCACLF